eukprot:1762535-Amphidinium_carterae.1
MELDMPSGPITLRGHLRKVTAQTWESEHLCAHLQKQYRTCFLAFAAHSVKAEVARHRRHESAGGSPTRLLRSRRIALLTT